jgi:dTDP-4-dehydrorhamnose reductase
MIRILVTGATGQLGQELQALAAAQYSPKTQAVNANFEAKFDYIFANRSDLALDNTAQIKNYFSNPNFAVDYCINCAAYTAVDKAETEQVSAFATNSEGVEVLAQECEKKGIKLLHISTDYAYHNGQNSPLCEDDATTPQGVYAASKLEGEKRALTACKNTIIVRTSWVYSSFGGNFVKTMLRLSEQRPALNVVFDQIGAPTYAADLAKALLHIIACIESKKNDANSDFAPFGQVYNYSNEGVTSWYDFAKAIFALKNRKCEVSPIRSSQYPTPAARPSFSLMDKSKIRQTFGLQIPHWLDSLKDCLTLL